MITIQSEYIKEEGSYFTTTFVRRFRAFSVATCDIAISNPFNTYFLEIQIVKYRMPECLPHSYTLFFFIYLGLLAGNYNILMTRTQQEMLTK